MTLPIDRRGLPVTAASDEAVRLLDQAVEDMVAFRQSAPARLAAALRHDPDCAIALIFKGFALKLKGRRRFDDPAQEIVRHTRRVLAERGGTAREYRLADALDDWCAGDMAGAADRLDAALDRDPLDLLAFRTVHGLRFLLGQPAEMRASTERALPAWTAEVPEAGYVWGCHAFGLEETGAYAEAERLGRAAVKLAPLDVWGAHAVSHVMEMQSRPHEGIDWLARHEAALDGCSSLAIHVWWHRALFHLALDQQAAALEVYDRFVAHEESDDFRDFCNAASLLWRIERMGVPVGDRWRELGRQAADRLDDHSIIFATIHYGLALAATGRAEALAALVASLDSAVAERGPRPATQLEVGERAGLPVVLAIRRWLDGRPGEAADLLMASRDRLIEIGGSHAQRDLFERFLIEAAIDGGRTALAERHLADRLDARPSERWGWRQLARLKARQGDEDGLATAERRVSQLSAA